MSTTRINHYVPQWYQRDFLSDSTSKLYYLDLEPDTKTLPDGRVFTMHAQRKWAPSKCFYVEDLYTTFFGIYVNDEIERSLFGQIDYSGSLAVRGFATGDNAKWHKYFEDFFLFMDAQKLRTPKGLDWIRFHYPDLGQTDLMVEMQALRALHCTLWTEGVREIVSAEDSEVKFLVTDHPVTIYNHACPPSDISCKYPNDPSIALNGSQTIFPLNRDKCLILTNLDYAKDPDSTNSLKNRINAGPMRNSMANTIEFICERKLSSSEVRSVNTVLKARARRYIAAAEEDWLYPEKFSSSNWTDHRKVLLPKADKVYLFGGQMFATMRDGSTYFQDEYGRTEPENKSLEKDPNYKPGRNDYCGCGSGKKFKKCCEKKSPEQRPAWDILSIRERNLALRNAVYGIFEIDKGKSWNDIRRELSSEQIVRFHEFYEYIWPKNTEIFRILPKPDDSLRAVFSGIIDPRTISWLPLGLTPYFDEILVQHPFLHPSMIKPDFNPLKNPEKYKRQMLSQLMLFLSIMPFVETGAINFFPDPCVFDLHLRQQSFSMARDRLDKENINEKEKKFFTSLMRDELSRSILELPREQQRQQILQATPNLTNEQVDKLITGFDKKQLANPLALLQDNVFGQGGQLSLMSMAPNYEMLLFVAQSTGSLVLTNSQTRWQELRKAENNVGKLKWRHVTAFINSRKYKICLNMDENLLLGGKGSTGEIRRGLGKLNNEIVNGQSQNNKAYIDGLKKELVVSFKKFMMTSKTGEGTWIESAVRCGIPVNGYVDIKVQRLLLKSGVTHYTNSVPIAVFFEPLDEPESTAKLGI